ncbi:histone-like nucleoid-structuring protein Lsr2 [Streptomyces abikoensis]|uniref:Lsr2 family DNA-binding protein n=1 Tax=Streptomyces abikoensis TaxID=97398 RepID=UPI0036AC8720
MAVRVRQIVDVEDDMTGELLAEGTAEQDFTVGIDGKWFTMDTHRDTANEIREFLAKAVANGVLKQVRGETVRTPRTSRNSPAARQLRSKIRYWGKNNGFKVADRGTFSRTLIEAYMKVHPDTDLSILDGE